MHLSAGRKCVKITTKNTNQDLHWRLPFVSAVVTNNEEEGSLRHFIIKREFAEGAILVKKVKFPSEALPTANKSAPALYRCAMPFLLRSEICRGRTSQIKTDTECVAVLVLYRGESLIAHQSLTGHRPAKFQRCN